jgi:BASS family bile acid:Na+ symporter
LLNVATLPSVVAHPDLDFLTITLVIVTGMCATAFASGYLLARACHVDRKQMTSLMFDLGMNNNGAGLVLASMALADHPGALLPIIFYNLIQHFAASIADFSLFRQPSG